MQSGLVSIVLCTFNGIKFIAPQLISIQKQTYIPLEIIIADDASTDGTYEWLHAEAEKDRRIRLFKNQHNIGFNLNFNDACRHARGEYIAFADQDDIWEPEKLSVLVFEIRQKKDTVLVHCLSAMFEKEGKPKLKRHKRINHFYGNDPRQFFLTNTISGHNMLLKKELIEVSMPFPQEVYYDWWLVLNACCAGKVKAVERVLVWHRIHAENATRGAKQPVLFCELTKKNLHHFLSIKNLQERYKNFGRKLLSLYKELPERKISFKLAIFLLRNSAVLFGYKKRTFPLMANIIRAFRLALSTKKA